MAISNRPTQGKLNRAIRNFDFEEFLLNHAVDVSLKGDELRGDCPLCQASSRAPFCVNVESGLWLCHGCNARGGPVQLIAKVLRSTYESAEERLLKNFVVFVNDNDDEWDDEELEEAVVEDTIELPEDFRPLYGKKSSLVAKPYRRYAKSRNITEEMMREYNIGYCASGYFAGRIIIPVYHLGKVVSFVARAITDNAKLKVNTPFGNHQGRYCFNLDNIWGTEEVVITEGVFDALVLPEMAVATFGKKISSAQVALLRKSGVRTVIFCYDEDALDDAYGFAEEWSGFFVVKLIELDDARDPSKRGREEMLELLPTAKIIDPYLVR